MDNEARRKRNADLIELLQASHDEIVEMRRLRATRVPSMNQLGGWRLVMASAIAILKEDADGWCANSTLTPTERTPQRGGIESIALMNQTMGRSRRPQADRLREAAKKVIQWHAADRAEDDGFVPCAEVRELMDAVIAFDSVTAALASPGAAA